MFYIIFKCYTFALCRDKMLMDSSPDEFKKLYD